jgi:hypothetical protein
MRVRFAAAVLAIAGLITVSCGGIIDPSKNTVDTFSNTLVPQGPPLVLKKDVGNNGEYSVKITALSPTPTAFLGLDLYIGANCDTLVNRNTFAALNQPAFSGLIQQKGTYCIVVYESIALAAPLNFTISFSHP